MKSISDGLIHIVEAMSYDYVDYKVEILNPTASPIYFGRCFKTPAQTYGVIDVTEILMNYCNHLEIFDNTNYLMGGTSLLNYPVLKYNISIKQPNSQLYLTIVESEEVINSWKNDYYNALPTIDTLPNILQHKREYDANINSPIMYDVVRKYFDNYHSVLVYYRPNGNNAFVYTQPVSKSQLNHFMFDDHFNINPSYVEVWTTTRTFVGGVLVETILPGSLIRYNYTQTTCRNNESVLYWINRYGGLEMKLVDGKTIKTSENTQDTFMTNKRLVVNGSNATRNSIAFNNGVQQSNIIDKYSLSFNYGITDDEFNYLETLFSAPNVWMFDIINLKFIPVLIKDTTYNYNYYRLNKKSIPSYTINIETSNQNTRR